jgi:hypothetical protein
LISATRVSPDSGYVPVTLFGRTLYLREGEPYVPAGQDTGQDPVAGSLERFKNVKFIECFMASLAMVEGVSDAVCGPLPQYPRCVVIANTVGTAVAAVGCGIYAYLK